MPDGAEHSSITGDQIWIRATHNMNAVDVWRIAVTPWTDQITQGGPNTSSPATMQTESTRPCFLLWRSNSVHHGDAQRQLSHGCPFPPHLLASSHFQTFFSLVFELHALCSVSCGTAHKFLVHRHVVDEPSASCAVLSKRLDTGAAPTQMNFASWHAE